MTAGRVRFPCEIPGSRAGKLIALVTGANKGLGKETARSLAEQGHTVLIGCRNLELGQQAVKELTSIGSPVEAICLDVS